jgi:hypothetical protein
MIRAILVLTVLLSACTDPQLGLGIALGPHGVAVRPTLSGNFGGVDVGVSAPIQ